MMRGMRERGNYGNRFLSHFIVDYDSFGIFVLIFNEIDMEAAKRYFLFADECGDQNLSKYDPNFPVFTLCGIIVTRDQVRNLEREIKALKQKYGILRMLFFIHTKYADVRIISRFFKM